jgi:hypothetical protein
MNETNFDHFAISFDAVFVAEFQETFSDELFDCESRRVPHIFNVTSVTFFNNHFSFKLRMTFEMIFGADRIVSPNNR